MKNEFSISQVLPVDPKELYLAWLNSKEHSAFTGAKAHIEAKVGGSFTAWDGYIKGKTILLEPYRRIMQTWRTAEFPEGSEDSILEVIIEEAKAGSLLTLVHKNIPEGQTQEYKKGWKDFYFTPMKKYYKDKR